MRAPVRFSLDTESRGGPIVLYGEVSPHHVEQEQYADEVPPYDAVAAYQTSRTTLQNLVSWIDTNMPRDGSNKLPGDEWTLVSKYQRAQLTAGQRTAYIAEINGLVATIEQI